MRFLPLLSLCLLAAQPAFAEASIDEQLKALKKPAEQLSADSAASVTPEFRSSAMEAANSVSYIESYIQNGDYDQAARQINMWIGRTSNKDLKKSLKTLQESLLKEQKKHNERIATKGAETLKKALADLARAKTSEQVSAVKESLESFRDMELNRSSSSTNSMRERFSKAINAVDAWQRVIVAEQAKSYEEALQSLRSLRSNSSYSFLDSELLAAKYQTLLDGFIALGAVPDTDSPVSLVVKSVMAKVKSADDASTAAETLRKLYSVTGGSENSYINTLQNDLTSLARLQSYYESGAYARVISNSSSDYNSPYSSQIDELETGLRVSAVIKANDLPDLGKPQPGEGFGTYLRRQAGSAYQKKDWPTLFAILSVYSTATGGGCSRTVSMQTGVSDFIAAQQLEKAGQYGNAVALYTACIAQIGPFVPREESLEALTRLRTAHPEAFKPTGNFSD